MVWTTINGSIEDDWLQIYMNFRVQKRNKRNRKKSKRFQRYRKKK